MLSSIKLHDHSFLLSKGAKVEFLGGNVLRITGIKVKGVEALMSYRVEFENDLAVQKLLGCGLDRIIMDKLNAMDKTKPGEMQEALHRHAEGIAAGRATAGRTSDPLVQEMKHVAMRAAKDHKTKNPTDERKLSEIRDEILTKHSKRIQIRAQENLDAQDEADFTL